MLNHDQLLVAIAEAKRQFGLIQKKYPDLKAYLVLSRPGGQTGIDSGPTQILNEFPEMVGDGRAKTRSLEILYRLKKLQKEDIQDDEADKVAKQKEQLRAQLDHLAPQLRYDENCQIEIRFKIRLQTTSTSINYELIWKLQEDELVDRNLTPHTKASIRIVLGTLSQFLSKGNNAINQKE